jgi:hypothetical protein
MDIELRMENGELKIEDKGGKGVWRRFVFDV